MEIESLKVAFHRAVKLSTMEESGIPPRQISRHPTFALLE
jgi:hypothetical protein